MPRADPRQIIEDFHRQLTMEQVERDEQHLLTERTAQRNESEAPKAALTCASGTAEAADVPIE